MRNIPTFGFIPNETELNQSIFCTIIVMKKILLSLLLFFSTLFASDYSMDAEYDIYYGFFGSVGVATASLSVENGTYKIKIMARATGLAKVLSRNRVETFESTGVVKDGILIPQIFLSRKKREGKIDIKHYLFDHVNKEVNLLSTRIRNKEKIDSKKVMPFFAQNDILTLFFNLKHILGKNFETKHERKLIAIGASDKNGKIDVRTILNKEYQEISKLIKGSDHILAVVLNQRIFASHKGEMFLNINDDGICTSALLKDVIMFGDIRGKIKNLKVKRLK
jgi:hypothetical protein